MAIFLGITTIPTAEKMVFVVLSTGNLSQKKKKKCKIFNLLLLLIRSWITDKIRLSLMGKLWRLSLI